MARWYDQVRRLLLRKYIFNFARKTVLLTPSANAPAHPEFVNGYALPNDLVRILKLGDRILYGGAIPTWLFDFSQGYLYCDNLTDQGVSVEIPAPTLQITAIYRSGDTYLGTIVPLGSTVIAVAGGTPIPGGQYLISSVLGAVQANGNTYQIVPGLLGANAVYFLQTAGGQNFDSHLWTPYISGGYAASTYVPPGSLTNLRDYTGWLAQQSSGVEGRQLDIADVVTRVEFDPDKQFVMKFSAVEYADDEYTLKVIDYIDANKLSDVAVGRNDVACDPDQVRQIAAAAPRPQIAPPAAAQERPEFGALPPRTAPARIEQATNQPGPAQEATPPKPRVRTPKPPAANGSAATAPFMAPAAQVSRPTPEAPAATSSMPEIPAFLRRTSEAPAPAAPTPRFGVGKAPTPPGPILDAVNQAMSLPTRRG